MNFEDIVALITKVLLNSNSTFIAKKNSYYLPPAVPYAVAAVTTSTIGAAPSALQGPRQAAPQIR